MKIQCPSCESSFIAEVHNDNEMFCCADCRQSFIVHGEKSFLAAKVTGSSPSGLKITCPGCTQHYDIDPAYCSQPLNCQVCGKGFIIPETRSAPSGPKFDFNSAPVPRPSQHSTPGAETPLPKDGRIIREITDEIKGAVKSKIATAMDEINDKKKEDKPKPKQTPSRIFFDFISFRIMIIPIILKWLWMLSALGSIIYGVYMIIEAIGDDSFIGVVGGILTMVFAPLITHMCLEMIMLLFSILDILREIRDK